MFSYKTMFCLSFDNIKYSPLFTSEDIYIYVYIDHLKNKKNVSIDTLLKWVKTWNKGMHWMSFHGLIKIIDIYIEIYRTKIRQIEKYENVSNKGTIVKSKWITQHTTTTMKEPDCQKEVRVWVSNAFVVEDSKFKWCFFFVVEDGQVTRGSRFANMNKVVEWKGFVNWGYCGMK